MHHLVGRKTGRRFHLDASALIGRGVEGRVYRFGDECVKVYDTPFAAADAPRMATLVSLGRKLERFACPSEYVLDPATGEDVGFVMPLVPGETLESLLESRRTGSIPPRTKILLAFRIAGAVAGAHALKGPRIALGDVLKAGNVLIDDDQATFVDVASASLFGYREPSGDVRDAVCQLSTPGYVPREALDNPGAIPCEASDRFALAVVLFELLFGKGPFEVRSCPASVGLEPDDAVRRGICPRFVLHPEFDAPTYDQVDLTPEVEQLFRAALLSSLRPSALDWARGLEAWLDATRLPDRPARRRRRPRWLRRLDPVTVLVVAIVLLAYAAKYAWTALASPTPTPFPASRPVGPPLFQELFR